jgi:hypothetical protein
MKTLHVHDTRMQEYHKSITLLADDIRFGSRGLLADRSSLSCFPGFIVGGHPLWMKSSFVGHKAGNKQEIEMKQITHTFRSFLAAVRSWWFPIPVRRTWAVRTRTLTDCLRNPCTEETRGCCLDRRRLIPTSQT